jgi:uncharacterized damage-inducible protein DinB
MEARLYLKETRDAFFALYESLSAEEVTRSGPGGAWSAADFAEHLATAERGIGVLLRRGLSAAPAGDEELAATEGKTEVILLRVAGAMGKVEAPEKTLPSGRYGAWPGALDALAEARRTTLGLCDEEGLAHVVAPHPAMGPLTGSQWLLFCGAHMERHRKQMAERFGR